MALKDEAALLNSIDARVQSVLMTDSSNPEVLANENNIALLDKIEVKMKDMDVMMKRMNEQMPNSQNKATSGPEGQIICNRFDERFIVNAKYEDNETNQEEQLSKSEPMDRNIFSMMIVSHPKKIAWWYGFVILVFQILAVSLIINEQFENSRNRPMWNVPIHVPSYISFGQFISLIIVMVTSDDFMCSIKNLCSFHPCSGERVEGDKDEKVEKDNKKEVEEDLSESEKGLSESDSDESRCSNDSKSKKKTQSGPTWILIVIPAALQFIQSFLILFASLVVIVQSEKIIQLFINLIALQVLSHCSKLGYRMSHDHYFGSEVADVADRVTRAQLNLYEPKHWKQIPIYRFIIIFFFTVMLGIWASVASAQKNRTYLKQIYNVCFQNIGSEQFDRVSDETCDGIYNTKECGYDGGDCEEFNRHWPGCTVLQADRVGDGICDGDIEYASYNTKQCGWDGGDCMTECGADWLDLLGNGHCDNFYPYNTAECSFDGGDCTQLNMKYQDCKCPKNDDECSDISVIHKVENGICDNYAPYNSTACKHDGGDCDFFYEYPNCVVDHSSWIGDGYCDNFPPYNTPDCGFDAGECLNLHMRYPNCTAPYLEYIGDGFCDGPLWNTIECKFDGGDCDDFAYPQCEAFDYWEIGNGRCWDKHPYNTAECGYDGGDCIDSDDPYPDCDITQLLPYFKWFPTSVGDKYCEIEFNTTECGYDGGDCIKTKKVKKDKKDDENDGAEVEVDGNYL